MWVRIEGGVDVNERRCVYKAVVSERFNKTLRLAAQIKLVRKRRVSVSK